MHRRARDAARDLDRHVALPEVQSVGLERDGEIGPVVDDERDPRGARQGRDRRADGEDLPVVERLRAKLDGRDRRAQDLLGDPHRIPAAARVRVDDRIEAGCRSHGATIR
jgi:hypothetical protein